MASVEVRLQSFAFPGRDIGNADGWNCGMTFAYNLSGGLEYLS
jgi:hypothetical protein